MIQRHLFTRDWFLRERILAGYGYSIDEALDLIEAIILALESRRSNRVSAKS